MAIPQFQKRWVGAGEAASLLKATAEYVRNLGESGHIRTRATPGSDRGRKYSVEDIDKILDEAAVMSNPIFPGDGPLNPGGRVPDWRHQNFIERADSCWMFMTAHLLLDAAESDRVRARLVEIGRSAGLEDSLLCSMAKGEIR